MELRRQQLDVYVPIAEPLVSVVLVVLEEVWGPDSAKQTKLRTTNFVGRRLQERRRRRHADIASTSQRRPRMRKGKSLFLSSKEHIYFCVLFVTVYKSYKFKNQKRNSNLNPISCVIALWLMASHFLLALRDRW